MFRGYSTMITGCWLFAVGCSEDREGSSSASSSTVMGSEGGTDTGGSVGPTTGGSSGSTGDTTALVDPTTTGSSTSGSTGAVEMVTSGETSSTGTTAGQDDTAVDVSTTAAEDTSTSSSSTGPDTTTGGTIEACKAAANPTNACTDCSCELCLEQYLACQDDEGCAPYQQCIQESACQGADCLVACKAVVDMHGGPNGPWRPVSDALVACQITDCNGACTPR